MKMLKMNFEELKPKVILAVGAHPDDIDFSSSGTIAKFASEGADVYYLILTDGSNGTADPKLDPNELKTIRQEEQRKALHALGGKEVFFLDYPDGALEVTQALKKDIVKIIRQIKPDVVVTLDPSVLYSAKRGMINHPDHRAAGQATLDAVFPLARDHLAFPELYKANFLPHKTKTVLLVNFDNPNYIVDISKTIEQKIGTLQAHKSQIDDITKMAEWFKSNAKAIGQTKGYRYGEGFMRIDLRS